MRGRTLSPEHDEDVFVDDEESGFVPMTHEEFLAHLRQCFA